MPAKILTFPTQPKPQVEMFEWLGEDEIDFLAQRMAVLMAIRRLQHPEEFDGLTKNDCVLAFAQSVGVAVQEILKARVESATVVH